MLRIDDIHGSAVIWSESRPQFPANALQSPRFYDILITERWCRYQYGEGEYKMKKKLILIIALIVASVLVVATLLSCAARFIFLSPSCYSDNDNLTEQENYFIKKLVLEAVEDRLSVFANNTKSIYDPSATEIEIIQLDESQNNRKHIFIWINTDFMESVIKENDEYIIRVQTNFMESSSDDCAYEIHMSEEFLITFFGLDP